MTYYKNVRHLGMDEEIKITPNKGNRDVTKTIIANDETKNCNTKTKKTTANIIDNKQLQDTFPNNINNLMKHNIIMDLIPNEGGSFSVMARTDLTSEPIKFLVDTAADNSIIKKSKLIEGTIYLPELGVEAVGIGNVPQKTEGLCFINLLIGRKKLLVEAQVVKDEFLPFHSAVLGQNFLKNCNILHDAGKLIINKILDDKINKKRNLIEELSTNKAKSIENLTKSEPINIKSVTLMLRNSHNDITQIRAEAILKTVDFGHLNGQDSQLIRELIIEFSDIFHVPGQYLKATPTIEAQVELKDNLKVIHKKQYRIPVAYKDQIIQRTQEMLQMGVIALTTSSWNHPIVPVRKKNGQIRLCVDFRNLNLISQDIYTTLPIMSEILTDMKPAKILSSLDLKESYLQIPIKLEHTEFLAFTCTSGKRYKFLRCPFGWKSSSFYFLRLIEIIMAELDDPAITFYVDDAALSANSISSMMEKLRKTFTVLRKHNITLNAEKCEFLKSEINFLGVTINEHGYQPSNQNIQTIIKLKPPENLKQTQRMLGLFNFFSKYISNYGHLTDCFYSLLRKDTKFTWSELCQKNFEALKEKLTTKPILVPAGDSKLFILITDASKTNAGGMLGILDGELIKPIAYNSKCLNKAQQNLSTYMLEFLSLIIHLRHWRRYLINRTCIHLTDHKALLGVSTSSTSNTNAKVVRWLLELQDYNLKICYIEGKAIAPVDFLSRLAESKGNSFMIDQQNNLKPLRQDKVVYKNFICTRSGTINLKDTYKTQFKEFLEAKLPEKELLVQTCTIKNLFGEMEYHEEEDSTFVMFVNEKLSNINSEAALKIANKLAPMKDSIVKHKNLILITNKMNINDESNCQELFITLCELLEIIKSNGVTHFKINMEENPKINRVTFIKMIKYIFKELNVQIDIYNQAIKQISNPTEIKNIIQTFHANKTSAHTGVALTYANIAAEYSFKSMRRSIKSFINECLVCQLRKNKRRNKTPMAHLSLGQDFADIFFLDLIGPLATPSKNGQSGKTGYKYDETQEKNWILTCVDSVTRYVSTAVLEDSTSYCIAKNMVTQIFLKTSIPQGIVVDNAANLISNSMKTVCKMLQIHHRQITVYNPNGNLVEIVNKNINEKLRCLVNKNTDDWIEQLPYVTYAINTSINTSTKYSPYYLLYARNPRNLCISKKFSKIYSYDDFAGELKYRVEKLKETAHANNEKRKANNKKYYDLNAKQLDIKINDQVTVNLPTRTTLLNKKLRPKRQGPYRVTDIISNSIITVQIKPNKTKNFHKNLVHIYNPDESSGNSDSQDE